MIDNKKLSKKLVTHNGSFHSDDVFAAAALSLMLENEGESFEIVRTRDPEIIKTGDYVFDVGGIYDPERNLFDHHQVGGAGTGPQKIAYSSIGLVWEKFGEKLAGSKRAKDVIQKKLCAPLDAWDNGTDIIKPINDIAPYYIQNIFFAMLPTWKEENLPIDEMYLKCVELAKNVLQREIVQAQDMLEAEQAVIEAYENADDKRIIVLEKNYPFEYILYNFHEPLFAVYPRKANDDWGVKAIKKDFKLFKNRKDLPASWGGIRDKELQTVTGVSDAVFCHHNLFVAAAKSKEGAIKLAQIAVESKE